MDTDQALCTISLHVCQGRTLLKDQSFPKIQLTWIRLEYNLQCTPSQNQGHSSSCLNNTPLPAHGPRKGDWDWQELSCHL